MDNTGGEVRDFPAHLPTDQDLDYNEQFGFERTTCQDFKKVNTMTSLKYQVISDREMLNEGTK